MNNYCILIIIIILFNSNKYTNKYKQYSSTINLGFYNKNNDKILSYKHKYDSEESYDFEKMKKQIKVLEKGLDRLDVYLLLHIHCNRKHLKLKS